MRLKVHGEECAAESPAGSRGRAAEGGQGEPNEAVGFLALGETGFIGFLKMLQDVPLGQGYSQARHYGGTPNIFSSVLPKSREWPWGVQTSQPPPVTSPLTEPEKIAVF